jgi:hypothetical protein
MSESGIRTFVGGRVVNGGGTVTTNAETEDGEDDEDDARDSRHAAAAIPDVDEGVVEGRAMVFGVDARDDVLVCEGGDDDEK